MTDSPARPPEETSLAQDEGEHGRIGYGHWAARITPIGLAVLIAIAIIAAMVTKKDDPAQPNGGLVGQPAPDITLTTFSGNTVRLADLRGSVVVLNFWAEWCAPCRQEMPVMQQVAVEAAANNGGVVIIGVDLKKDFQENAVKLAESLGITYPVGQDLGGDNPNRGPIELAFGIEAYYPTTIFIRPDGTIDAVRLGPMDEKELRQRIADARD